MQSFEVEFGEVGGGHGSFRRNDIYEFKIWFWRVSPLHRFQIFDSVWNRHYSGLDYNLSKEIKHKNGTD